MNDRSTNLKSIRPTIATALVNEYMSADECFSECNITTNYQNAKPSAYCRI